MTNFALYACGSWRDGQPPIVTPVYVVSYDQTNTAYQVDRRKYDEFVEWVARTWERNDDGIGDDETAEAYLERRGIQIKELQWS